MIKPLIDVIPFGNDEKYSQVMIHHRVAASHQAAFAMDLMRASIMLGAPTGERNADGVDYFKPMTPEQVVDRAIAISEIAFAKFEAMQWTQPVPSFDSLREESGQQAGFVTTGSTRGKPDA